ncbi:hypothetical protein LTS08_007281 [Lithohypha guttulata]|nr:hypothetical protein LTS08_007281 [Lithohypha guttulata]
MDAARAAVSKITSHGGERTDVDEVVRPVVTEEVVKPHRHEETTEAVDKEIHQHHYHTTVQPLADKQVLPEQHVHNVAPQIERSFEHGNLEQDRARAAAEMGQFQNTSTTLGTTQSTQAAPAVVGQHVHHHVHEVVQPVIHQETIQNEVVHTTIPIHETHVAPSEHHGISMLPLKSMDEFSRTGTDLKSGQHAHEEYEGHPKPYNESLQLERAPVDVHPEQHEGRHDPDKTGHREWLRSHDDGSGFAGESYGNFAGTAPGAFDHSSTTSTTGGTGSGIGSGIGSGTHMSSSTSGANPLHQGADVRHGSGALVGGTTTGAASGLGNELSQNTSSNPTGITGSSLPGTTGTTGTTGGMMDRSHPLSGDTVTSGTSTISSHNTSRGTEGLAAGTAAGLGSSSRDSPAVQQGSERQGTREPSNLEGGRAGAESSQRDFSDSDKVQHASRIGKDPSLTETNEGRGSKLTGTGVDGSHSAVFGLTPDGHVNKDTSSQTTKLSEHNPSSADTGVGPSPSDKNRGVEGVAGQMNDMRVAEPEHSGKAEYQPGSDNKPGMGA